MSFVIISVGMDYRDLQPIDQTDGIYANLVIFESVVDALECRTFENSAGIFEGNSVPFEITEIFVFFPDIFHSKGSV